MDEQTAPKLETPPVNSTSAIPPPQVNKKTFLSPLKIFFILVAVGLLLGGGRYLGSSKKISSISPTPSPTQSAIIPLVPIANHAISPTSAQPKKIIKAGLTDSSTSFKPYNIEIPLGWIDNHEPGSVVDKLTISKNGYSVVISQGAMGGGGCVYKGDPPQEMAQSFTDFVGITGKEGQYRRSWTTEGEYTICQKSSTENSYGFPTQFGAINVKTPTPSDSSVMAEIDGMIASITK